MSKHFRKFSTVSLWNSRIRDAVNQGHALKALTLFRQMKQNDFRPDNLTFPFIAKACAKLSNPKYSLIIHTHITKSQFWCDVFVQTAMVDMYVKCAQLDYACNMFERMPDKDVASWNVMLMGFAQVGFLDRALLVFRDMRLVGIEPDAVTVMGLIQSVLCSKNLKLVMAVHSFGIQIGVAADVSVANTWISAYAKCDDLDSAEMVFDEIELGLRTIISCNSMIAGYANSGKYIDAVKLYKRMLTDGFMPDLSTVLNLLSSCVEPDALFQGSLIHCHGIQSGCDSDMSVINTLISMYSKCGDVDSARSLFDSMPNRTCVSWTAMISGYADKGNMDDALALFNAMEATQEKPDMVTVLSMISSCSQTGALDLGKWIDDYANLNGLRNSVVCNALIDMYAKCGSLNDARDLFYAMPERTIVSWTAMIMGCALNGEFKEALDLFYFMLEIGLKPNHITFLAVLQACSHSGSLEKGWDFFDMMTKVYRVRPGLDHYSCIVDLLGRKGKLKEAFELVQSMPIKPDSRLWGTLLSACKIHRNVEIGEYVASRLFELEPEVAAPYVEMANIYASEGKWDGVAMVRSMMKCNKVRKCPGQSFVQVNGKNHVFTVEDRGHGDSAVIYALLDDLALQSKMGSDSLHSEVILEHEL